jgi:GTPase SAR1 family protein
MNSYYLPLSVKVDQFFAESLQASQEVAELADFCGRLQMAQRQLKAPMRVAIVGLIKAGKSTLMNAILGDYVVFTDTTEATFNVNKFTYSEQKSLVVYYKEEGRSPEPKPFEALKDLTARDEENWDYLSSIKYVEVFYPNPILKKFSLIDTPGLESSYDKDSVNTQDYLVTDDSDSARNQKYWRIHGAELARMTQSEAQGADAVIYLFSKNVHQSDRDFLQKFAGSEGATISPLNAIGSITQIDKFFLDVGRGKSLVAVAQEVAEALPIAAQTLFYQIQPISGFLAWGAQNITDREWQILEAVAQIPESKISELLFDYDSFVKPDKKLTVSVADRILIRDRLDLYGISLVYDALNEGLNDRVAIVDRLYQASGVQALVELITSHFGNRAEIIKLSAVFRQLEDYAMNYPKKLYGQPEYVLSRIIDRLRAIASEENSFKEIRILQDYYAEKLQDFTTTEMSELLQITGEEGSACYAKLGLLPGASLEEMLLVATAKMNYWQSMSQRSSAKSRLYLSAADR